MAKRVENEDRPINLEESSLIELQRAVVSEDDGSSSTMAPVWVPKPHAKPERRELLGQPFGSDPVK